MVSSSQRRENAVELFLSTKSCKMNYIGPCAVDVKVMSKMFIVEPYDKGSNAVELSVYSLFVRRKNILFHFSSTESTNLALVFPTVDACSGVHDILMAYQLEVKQELEVEHTCNQQIRDLFFIPLLKEAKSNPSFKERSKDCILNLLEDIVALVAEQELDNGNLKSELDEALREEMFSRRKELLNESTMVEDTDVAHSVDDYELNGGVKIEPGISFSTDGVMDLESISRSDELENIQNDSRKRHRSLEADSIRIKQCKIEVLDEVEDDDPPVQSRTTKSTVILQAKKIVKSTHFLIRRTPHVGRKKHELSVFISDEKNLCYQYCFERKTTGCRFSCINCQKRNHSAIAHLRCDEESGEYFIEFGLIKHICTPVIYDNKLGIFIVPCTLYASLFFQPAKIKQRMKVSVNEIVRLTLNMAKSRDTATSEHLNDPIAVDHLCDSHSVEPSTSKPATSETRIIPAETVAPSPDASLIVNQLGSSNSPEPLTTENQLIAAAPETILKFPDFELRTIQTFHGIMKYRLIVFASPDHKLCYVFVQNYPHMRFICRKCQYLYPNITAFVRVNDNGERYVFFNGQKHHCEPELYSRIISNSFLLMNEDYFITFTREGNIRVIIYDLNDKNLCYSFSSRFHRTYICDGCENIDSAATLVIKKGLDGEYELKWKSLLHSCKPKPFVNEIQEKVLMGEKFKLFYENDTVTDLKLFTFPFEDNDDKCHIYKYSKVLKLFYCLKCLESNHFVFADIFINGKREQYILESNPEKHICDPIDYSTLDSNNFVIQTSTELELKKFNEKCWNENNCIIAENFELQRNLQGVLNGYLMVFATKNEKLTCYKYYYEKSSSTYICQQCKVTAKLFFEDGKYFVKLSTIKHRCRRVGYKPEKTIIRKPDFMLFDELKPIRLIVFTSPSHQNCYVYSSEKYKCYKCLPVSVYVTLFTDENGAECVYLHRQKHVCQPQKFENVVKKYNIKL